MHLISRKHSDSEATAGPLESLRGVPKLATRLRDDTMARLASSATTRSYARGVEIYADEARHVGILVAGRARVYLHAWDGRQLTVRHQRPGAFLGKVPLAGNRRIRVRIEAQTPCVLLEIPLEEFRAVLAAQADLGLAVHLETMDLLEATYATLGINVFGTVRDRLVHILLELAERDPDSDLTWISATQQQLADDIGSTREVVSRTLSELSAEGLVSTGKGRIELLQPGRLAATASPWTPPSTWAVLA